MSWKATAYVKELGGERVTVYEKLLLFVLADAHNNEKEIAWPSIATLSEQALMTERTVYKLLVELEKRNIIRRVSRPGILNAYQFVELDCGKTLAKRTGKAVRTPARNSGGIKNTTEFTPERTPESRRIAIRKNGVEPVYITGKSGTDNLIINRPSCERCGDTGVRASDFSPGRKVQCECQDRETA